MQTYNNDFDDWESVQGAFCMDEPEPTKVIFADYTYENYSGYAAVLYKKGREYYLVGGSHCSCYGLEGQWEPEGPMTKKVIREMIDRQGNNFFGFDSDEVKTAL